MPEIREQAYDVARIVSRSLHGESRRRPVDPYGLTLSTSGSAAERYNAALGRLLRLQDGVEEGLAEAVAEDEGFVQAHAALALLGHEWGTNDHWHASLRAAHRAAADRHLDDRESSFLDAVTTRLRSDEPTGAAALLRHVRLFPRDALAVSVAVPDRRLRRPHQRQPDRRAGRVAGRSYGDDWWYAGQLAFVRQDQERWAEAEELASYALSVEPASGHAVHARAHVFYETGDHAAGLAWLDEWIRTRGPEANHRSHFSWHAALHELMQDDVEAVRRRYAPRAGAVRGQRQPGRRRQRRAAVARPRDRHLDRRPAGRRGAGAGADGVADRPADAVRRHAQRRAARRRRRCRPRWPRSPTGPPAARTRSSATWSRRCAAGSASVVEERWNAASATLSRVVATMAPLGGSKAQREVVEDTLVHALAMAGRTTEAADLLDARLSRRSSALDARRRAAVAAVGSGPGRRSGGR